MGLFDRFKKKGIMLGAPVGGKCINVTEVSDPTFSGEILGKGIAVVPMSGSIKAPAAGEITTAFATGHAVTMTTEEGAELLIHIGIDTVALKGENFSMKVKEGQKVAKGDLLVEADMEKIKAAGYDTSVIMVVCNMDAFPSVKCITGKDVMPGEDVIELGK
ncbi:MAG: PTS glucose transporter subunit IIA [Eubacteriales bacterium]|nr:PTS glucose transporter subunit IIA [Eubacteriales bacterium]